MMKTVLVIAAAMGLSISAASAECVGHKQTTASVDTETTVASVLKQTPAQPAEQTSETEEAVEAE
jgi:hypothetical protein